MSKQPGVQAVKVSLKNEEAAVTYDPSLTDPGVLREAIDDMGFDTSLLSPSASPRPTNDVQLVMINVDGMTCNSCVQTIEKNISQRTGVQSISVSLAAKTAQVQYSPEKVTAEQLREAIEDMGFDAGLIRDDICNVNKDVRTAMISVEGMTCMSCVNTIEGTMSNKPGVHGIKVSLTDKQAAIEYDEAVTTPEDLRAGIEDMGFDALLTEDVKGSKTEEGAVAVEHNLAGDWQVTFSKNGNTSRSMEAIVEEDLEKIYLHITGMTCVSCVGSIEKGLMKKNGVKSVLVGLLAQKAEVKFDKKKITTDEIICHVKELGFDCDLLEQCGQGEGTVDLIITGMTCSSCVHLIESNLTKRTGILQASVALATSSGRFVFDTEVTGPGTSLRRLNHWVLGCPWTPMIRKKTG
ncbi:ATPase Cu transporting protein 7B [Desmophyllum pertusum]|uniref:ATPase Cu transporting protein 7B n=1 Tax=Desmophyllum pertusum TaxID=174260 RepID=A0A9W9ZQ02_9CNID|nr:ATPase Cu transporting protein 7B [Desmophyllum pertusum]